MGQTRHVPPKPSRRSAQGFTVMELIIVLSIVAILTATAVPAMREFNVRSTVSTNANDVVAALNLARSEAVKRGRNVAVVANGGSWTAGWTVQTETAAVEVLARHDAFTADYRVLGLVEGAGVSDRVRFSPTGSLVAANGFHFSVCRPTFSPGNPQSRRVVVAATGMVRTFRDTSTAPAGSC